MSDWLQDHGQQENSDPKDHSHTPEQPDTQSAANSEEPGKTNSGWVTPQHNQVNGNTTTGSSGQQYTTDPVSGWRSAGGYYGPPKSVQTPPTSPYGWQYTPPTPQKPPQKRKGVAVLVGVLSVLCVVTLVVTAFLLGRTGLANVDQPSTTSTTSQADGTSNAPKITTMEPKEEGLTTQEIVARNLDSTVVITMYTKRSGFFGTAGEVQAGAASGIVWTEDGYIITNAHCVYNDSTRSTYSRIKVTLYNQKEYDAKIVGYDVSTDLAVIKIDATGLKPATFGDSSKVQLGDRVIVLGNNGGYGWSVTQGIISGLARDVYEETNYAIKCLQTDAVINPGNSGGPMLNSSGQVIAINSAKIVATGYEGLGFSIPINEAIPILEDLVAYSYVKGRVMLGITGQTFSYTGFEGFQILSVNDESSLKGKVEKGDIITHVNNVRVKNYEQMQAELIKHKVGDTVTLKILRFDADRGTPYSFEVKATLLENTGK